MKNTFKILLFAVIAIVATAINIEAQTAPTRTTLSVAMNAGARQMQVTSATGFLASTNQVQYYVLVEKDLRQVTAISGTVISLGASTGSGVGHPSGSTVIFGTAGNWQTGTAGTNAGSVGVFHPSLPTGGCSRVNNQYLPGFVTSSTPSNQVGSVDCLGGKWITGTLPDENGIQPALAKVCTVPIGSVAYGSFGTSTTGSTTAEYHIDIFVPYTFLGTGITTLNGSAVDTAAKRIVMLHDMAGNLVVNSATAGTTATGNDAFSAIAFTTPALVVGPAWYILSMQIDTADANGFRTVAASTFNGVVAGTTTSTFGTIGTIVPPTTFTGDTGTISCLY